MTRIKFCGMTSPADVALAVEAGADAVGIICAPSERRVTLARAAEIARAIPPFIAGFGVSTPRATTASRPRSASSA